MTALASLDAFDVRPSYAEAVLADAPLLYLTGETASDEVGAVPAELLGGVTAGASRIAPGLGGSFAIPDLGTDPTVTAVRVPSGSALALGGFPAVEYWMYLDHDTPGGQGGWVTGWVGVDGDSYFGFYPFDPVTDSHWDAMEPAFGNPFLYGDADSPFTPGSGPWHVVTYYGADGGAHALVNGVPRPNGRDDFPITTPGLAADGDLWIGCSTPTTFGGPYAGIDRTPGRISDFAVYAGADARDVAALAARHYALGLVGPPPPDALSSTADRPTVLSTLEAT